MLTSAYTRDRPSCDTPVLTGSFQRSTMAWGLEARVPFLDKAFLDVAMNVRPEDKMFSKGAAQELDEDGRPKMEKYILRKAFDVAPDGKVCRDI